MTRLLVRVADAADAATAAMSGSDAIEVRVAGERPDETALRAIRAAFPGRLRLRFEAAPDRRALDLATTAGVDEVAVPCAAVADAAALLDPRDAAARPTLVAVIPVTLPGRLARLEELAGRADAVLLDAGDRRLVDALAIPELDAFARACRACGLPFGLAGGLEAPDAARLLLLRPDLLGFDVALRRDHRADFPLDRLATDMVRALVPAASVHPASGTAGTPATAHPDRVFVRDFVALLSIGAYQAERGARQRVRFGVEADVLRPAEPPADMRGVFSYDVIIETIRVLASRAHVTFVETLAEEIAAILLTYPQITAATVTVEKLDVVEGAVGVTIRRDRASGVPS